MAVSYRFVDAERFKYGGLMEQATITKPQRQMLNRVKINVRLDPRIHERIKTEQLKLGVEGKFTEALELCLWRYFEEQDRKQKRS
jgi:hypothetical protein